MAQSWSKLRKILEEDLLCPSLRGKIKYFLTLYRKAHDQAGRFAVRYEGEEIFQAHPFNVSHQIQTVEKMRLDKDIPRRTFDERLEFLHDEANLELEEEARLRSHEDGFVDSYDVSLLIDAYLSMRIEDALDHKDPVIRMFAILDRRVGKRSLEKLKERYAQEPKWLQTFYEIRFRADDIKL